MNQRKAGAVLSYLSTATNALVQLIYVPLLLFFLTKQQYGLYQLMGSMIAYLSIMDFGLSNTTTRYLAQALATQDVQRQNRIISSSIRIYSWIAICLVSVGIVGYFLISPIYGKTLTIQELITAKRIFLVLLFNIAVFIPSNIFVAIINAHEKFIFLRGVNLLKIVLQPCLVCAVLSLKADVLYLVYVQTLFTLAVIALNYFYCRFKLRITFIIRAIDKQLIKELTGFSVFIFLHSLMDQIYWRSGQLILGAISGTTAVAFYSIAMQLSLFAAFTPTLMSSVFLPKLSQLALQKDTLTQINLIFCKLGRLQFILISLLFAGFFLLGKTFIYLWIGPGYEISYTIALIIMAGYILDVTQNVGIAILQAMKKHAFRAYVYVAMAFLNIVLSIWWGKTFGAIGCAASTVFCLFLGSGVAINWYYYHIGLDIKQFFANLLKLSVPILLACVAEYSIQQFWPLETSWLSLFLHGIVFVIIYSLLVWNWGLNDYEKNLILKPLQYIKNKKCC